MKLIVATRPSLLAYTQTMQTVELLKANSPGVEFEIVKFSTQGDKVADKSLTAFGGTGIFVKELENAIMKKKANFAIHSLKDIPSFTPESLCLASFPKREDPRDIILVQSSKYKVQSSSSNIIEYLKSIKAIIGTGSPRRIVQLSQIFPNADFKDLRGNIDTRLRKLSEGNYDAIILAAAGLKRLGYLKPETQDTSINSTINLEPETLNYDYLDFELSLPAIGQGVIALECRKDDVETIKILRTINDINSEIAVNAERGFMIEMEGNCKFPLAAHAEINSNIVTLNVIVGNPATKQILKLSDSSNIDKAEKLGINLALKIRPQAQKLGIL